MQVRWHSEYFLDPRNEIHEIHFHDNLLHNFFRHACDRVCSHVNVVEKQSLIDLWVIGLLNLAHVNHPNMNLPFNTALGCRDVVILIVSLAIVVCIAITKGTAKDLCLTTLIGHGITNYFMGCLGTPAQILDTLTQQIPCDSDVRKEDITEEHIPSWPLSCLHVCVNPTLGHLWCSMSQPSTNSAGQIIGFWSLSHAGCETSFSWLQGMSEVCFVPACHACQEHVFFSCSGGLNVARVPFLKSVVLAASNEHTCLLANTHHFLNVTDVLVTLWRLHFAHHLHPLCHSF